MKRVEGWVEMEHCLRDGPWKSFLNFGANCSVDQARKHLEHYQSNPAHPDSTYRLVYVRVETTREVLN